MVLIITGTAAGVWYFFSRSTEGSISVGALSERGRQFVDAQRSDPASSWQAKQLEPTESLAVQPPSQLQETPCFSLNIPFPIRSVQTREPHDCVLQIRLTSPAAKLTVSMQLYDGTLENNPDVHMREVVTETYTPEEFQSDFFKESKTFSEPEGVHFFAMNKNYLLAVIFSETNDQEKILSESLPKVLEALMIYE